MLHSPRSRAVSTCICTKRSTTRSPPSIPATSSRHLYSALICMRFQAGYLLINLPYPLSRHPRRPQRKRNESTPRSLLPRPPLPTTFFNFVLTALLVSLSFLPSFSPAIEFSILLRRVASVPFSLGENPSHDVSNVARGKYGKVRANRPI